MNVLFLLGETLKESDGISKKILAQEEALKRLGCNVILSYLKADDKGKFIGRFAGEEMIDQYSEIDAVSKLQSRIKYKNLYNYILANHITLVYVRYVHFATPYFISFLKHLKKKGIIVLLEIPTYPYDQEYNNLKFSSRMIMLVEKLSRQKFKKYVTRIITVTPHLVIFGVPAVEISNGIDALSVPMIKKRKENDEIHMIGVASLSPWHGFDRVIEGLHNYYNQHLDSKKIFFHIVGDHTNEEGTRYKMLMKRYHLNDYVIFHGKKSGNELDLVFDKADVGVGSLACHRISIKNVKALKNREYCARGLPFFYSETDVDFEGMDFIFRVPANESAIDIQQIINFLDHRQFDPSRIRNFAVQNLSWDKQFKKVLNDVLPGFMNEGELQTVVEAPNHSSL